LKVDVAKVPVFVLCGGLGTRLREETEVRPKPMVPIGDHPILWHIMRSYSHHGFKTFILCLGYKAEVIKSYFLNYPTMNSDFTVELNTNSITVHKIEHGLDWTVTLADTGALTMTGARVARAATKYLGDAEHFAVTYGDGVTDANLADEFQFHLEKGKVATILGVNPPSRFGDLNWKMARSSNLRKSRIYRIIGLMVVIFSSTATSSTKCVLGKEPPVKLARDRELNICKHHGFWYAMDTQRDREYLDKLWKSGKAPWNVV